MLYSFFVTAQAVTPAPDEDTSSDLTCPSSGVFEDNTTRDVDLPGSVNVGTADDRSCYSDYSESSVYGKTWGVYNITDGSNHWDPVNTLQPRIERSLSRSQEFGVGSFAKFTGIVRILEVGDATGTNNDGTYIMQAKGKHTGGGGSSDPAICLYLAKPVYGTGVNSNVQVSFDIYREQINVRGGEGATGRDFVFLKNVLKDAETAIELEVGFRVDPNDASKRIHYADAVIGGDSFDFNIPEPERGTQSGIRYGAYRVKGGRAQIRWANTTYQKEEVVHVPVILTGQTITSASSGDWNEGSTWVDGVVPTSLDDVVITDVTVTVAAGMSAECNDLTVNGTEGTRIIAVQEGASLQINGDLITNRSQDGVRLSYTSAATLNRDVGTIIINGDTKSDATTTDNRRALVAKILPSNDDWHLISVGSTNSRQNELARTATASNNYNIVTKGGSFSIGSYNGNNAVGAKYEYIAVPTLPATAYANGVAFDKTGYSVKVNNTATPTRPEIRLRPVIEYADVSEDISDAGDRFNLVGNPYFAYLHANTAADAANNLLTVNNNVLDEQTIWIWNNAKSGGAGFETYNLSDASLRIQPLQAFFVKAKSGGGTAQPFSISKIMRSHTKAGAFLKSSNDRFEIDLSITTAGKTASTSIRYIDNMTADFDNGYDSSIFSGYSSALEVYSGLVQGNSTKKLAKQSLPNTNYQDLVVPIGITATVNSEITFTTAALNVPEGYKVYLEDRLNSTFTRLDKPNAEYKVTITEANTEGRFFIHTKTAAILNIDSAFLNSVRIYKANNILRIAGLKEGKTSVKLFNILGKQVMSSNFIANGVKTLSLPRLAKGVYVVHLETVAGYLKKKIILE